MFITLAIAFLVLLFLYSWITKRPKNFPPGPPCLPIVGSAPFLDSENFHFLMEKWRGTYGPVVGLVLGSMPAVAVVEARTVLEVIKREEFQGRPDSVAVRDRTFGERLGVFFSEGPYWVEQRRFTLRHLRDFGFGKKSMEGLILEEIEELLKEMKLGSPKKIQVSMLFAVSVINVLWAIMCGSRYKRDDKDFQILLEKLNYQFRSGDPSGGGIINMIPSLRYMVPHWKKQQENQTFLHNFMRKAIREHEQTFDENNLRDFIDVYIREMQHAEANSTFTEKSLVAICMDLFAAGAESVSNSLGFCILHMVRHPDVQKKVQQEIDDVVGKSRRPSLDDKPNLVYTEATILEVMRVNTIAPSNVPRKVTRNTTIKGYDIPKDTMVLISLWSCTQDVEHWGDPENFRPERFIGADGRIIRDEFMAVFGAGRRVCLGEPLAKSILFLFFATIMQDLSFKLPPGDELPSTIPLSGFTVAPQPFEVIAEERA